MRKAKPVKIYREEVIDLAGNRGSTRQTFDLNQYTLWRKLERADRYVVAFYEGNIEWSKPILDS